ncbi:alpha/beta fold hydrolase [Mesorhizobium sp. 1B3]|uniref:alpha/beta fold hydrolase n=1 Tax=Mesorhizobium sp. 1B3 TaxID=3243599 RepID=UPI003D97F8DC
MSSPMSNEMRSRWVDGAAGKLHLTDFGGSGPIILALHGVTGGSYLWSGVASAIADDARMIALDFRGHGRSDWSLDHAYETKDLVADLRLVIDQIDFGDEPPTIMGSSWGALAAVLLLSQTPEAARKLLIVDVEPSFETRETDVPPRPYRFPSLESAIEWERLANRNAPQKVLAEFTRASMTRTEDGYWMRRHDPYFLTRWPFRKDDLWEELSRLVQPVKVIRGEESFVRRGICERMVALNEGWRFSEIPKSGHLVPLEQPYQLAREIAEFIKPS